MPGGNRQKKHWLIGTHADQPACDERRADVLTIRPIPTLTCLTIKRARRMSEWIWWEQLTWGYRFQQTGGLDVIKIVQVSNGDPDQIRFDLTTVPPVNWAKAIRIIDSPVDWGWATTNGDNRGPSPLVVQAIPPLVENAALEFRKAAFLGQDTGFYKVGDLFRYRGKVVVLEWRWDW